MERQQGGQVTYLSHCHRPLLSEGVVIEVEDAKACVVLQSFGQRRHARMIDAVLRHVNFFQSANQLEKGEKNTN